mmetsp:Transcript_170119/g.540128  ORF Transcript_170119/g.540128 Transcript_170119/m.540128 type:complete len:206 (+) Transcript_170119:463-1080(+)
MGQESGRSPAVASTHFESGLLLLGRSEAVLGAVLRREPEERRCLAGGEARCALDEGPVFRVRQGCKATPRDAFGRGRRCSTLERFRTTGAHEAGAPAGGERQRAAVEALCRGRSLSCASHAQVAAPRCGGRRCSCCRGAGGGRQSPGGGGRQAAGGRDAAPHRRREAPTGRAREADQGCDAAGLEPAPVRCHSRRTGNDPRDAAA